MRLYDTRTRQVEEVTPASPRLLRVYCCGPTVYRDQHVGNLRTYLLADLVRRTAETVHGWRVHVVQNITDVGHLADESGLDGDPAAAGRDKLLAESARSGTDALTLARHFEDRFHRDLSALGCRPAEDHPRASESVPDMLDLVASLVGSGHAYVGTDGSVYFDAHSDPGYGQLSGNRLDRLRPGHRFGGSTAPGKRFHADWALWRRAGDRRELVWDSPWGPGFPGWHVECSAMSLRHLGDLVDVHLGGIDLRFPHHEDERAQSDAVAGHEVVRHWVHGEHLLFEGRKMAKSAGNVVLLDDLRRRGLDPLSLRLAMLATRYRTQVDLRWAELEAADATLTRWRARMADWAESPSRPARDDVVAAVHAAFADDLDTPTALQVLRRLEKDDGTPPGTRFETLARLDALLGLDLARAVGGQRPVALPPGARELLDRRAAARAARDFATADALRAELTSLGVRVADTPGGQTWTLTD